MKLTGIVFLAVAVPVLLAPKAGTAQIPVFESSMDVICLAEDAGGACTQLGFLLDITGNGMDTQVDLLAINNQNTDKWFFVDALGFEDASGMDRLDDFIVMILPAVNGSQTVMFQLAATSGVLATGPVLVTLDVTGSSGTAQDLAETFAYAGTGSEYDAVDFEFNGVAAIPDMTVVPEPMTLTLVATGLLGLGGARAARRRRKLTDN